MLHLLKQIKDDKWDGAAKPTLATVASAEPTPDTNPPEAVEDLAPSKDISMQLLPTFLKHAEADRKQRFRDRRAFYASSVLSCSRDQFWEATGVKQTDRADFLGVMKMALGSAAEEAIVKTYLSDLHWYGIHLLGTQIPVGGSEPNWDGYLDALLAFKNADGLYRKYVVEVKSKSGYGADLLAESMIPADEYLAQLGLYLKDLSEKGVTNEGCLLYLLMSDNYFGHLLQIHCRYEKETQDIVAYRGDLTDGTWKELNVRYNIGGVLKRLKKIDDAIKSGKEPKADYQYKYPVTPELAKAQSDSMLLRILNGQKVLGDWQVIYSRYKTKQLKTDGIELGYTEAEIQVFRDEYRKRKPKSKK